MDKKRRSSYLENIMNLKISIDDIDNSILPKIGALVKVRANLNILTGNDEDRYFVGRYQDKIGLVLYTLDFRNNDNKDKVFVCLRFKFPKKKEKLRWFHLNDLRSYKDVTKNNYELAIKLFNSIPRFGSIFIS